MIPKSDRRFGATDLLAPGDTVWLDDAVSIVVKEVFTDRIGEPVSFYGQGADGRWHAIRLVSEDGRPLASLASTH